MHDNRRSKPCGRAPVDYGALLVVVLAVITGCSREAPVTGVTPIKAADSVELQKLLLARKPEVDLFRLRGP